MHEEPKKDIVALFDDRINRLERTLTKRIKKIEKVVRKLESYVDLAWKISAHDSTIISYINHLSIYSEGKVQNFDQVIEHLKTRLKYEKDLPKGYEAYALRIEFITHSIIFRAKEWGIPFNILASYLINKLGKRLAKLSVKKENLLKNYGKDAVSTWKSILEE